MVVVLYGEVREKKTSDLIHDICLNESAEQVHTIDAITLSSHPAIVTLVQCILDESKDISIWRAFFLPSGSPKSMISSFSLNSDPRVAQPPNHVSADSVSVNNS